MILPARQTRVHELSPVVITVPVPSECPIIPYLVGVIFNSSVTNSNNLSVIMLLFNPSFCVYDAAKLSGYSGLRHINPFEFKFNQEEGVHIGNRKGDTRRYTIVIEEHSNLASYEHSYR